MPPGPLLAIDQGTTSSRVMLFDSQNFTPVANHSAPFPQHYPEPGWVEHNAEEILESVRECIRGVYLENQENTNNTSNNQKSHTKQKPSAIGITNQRETVVAWDRKTGKAFYNAIVWMDTRTSGVVKDVF
jgi:glycerol kinase